jgi:mannose-6-phosphate isomerase
MTELSEFWLLHGFKNAQLIKQTIATVPEFAFMLPIFEKGGHKALYEYLMTIGQEKVDMILDPLLRRVMPLYEAGKLDKTDPGFWAARAALTFNTGGHVDRGIFSIYLFNIVHLSPGEGIFQDAGILHAYLEGQNVEIMANSDNVLRGGLTPKHIDVPELMKHVIFEPVEPQVVRAQKVTDSESVFLTPAPDFELSLIKMEKDGEQAVSAHSVDIFLVMEGSVEIDGLGKLDRGAAFVAFAGSSAHIRALSEAVIYRARVPAGS